MNYNILDCQDRASFSSDSSSISSCSHNIATANAMAAWLAKWLLQGLLCGAEGDGAPRTAADAAER